MDLDESFDVFRRIVAAVSSSIDPNQCWEEILEITGEQGNSTLASVNMQFELDSIVTQVGAVLREEAPPPEIRLLWFGLFDGLRGDREYAGYYLAGWTDEKELDKGGPPPYFPNSRYLTSQLLDLLKDEARRVGEDSPRFAIYDYALMFGAAATLSRFAVRSLQATLPVFVGFDSGDFAQVAN